METRSTTVLAVKHKGQVAMAADGQVTVGETVVKKRAQKLRRLYKDQILVGFAGSAADALTLFDKFEAKLEEYRGNLRRAAVELAKDWRTDRILRRLEALLAVADKETLLLISGSGDVIEPDDGLIAVGSGSSMAIAAARALAQHSDLDAEAIARESLLIAADICIYTNREIQVEVL